MIQLLLASDHLDKMMAAKTAYASEVSAPSYLVSPDAAIRFWADVEHVSYYEVRETIRVESGFNPSAVGDNGCSLGISQINICAHKNITREQALDPDWSLQWMTHQFSIGNAHIWTAWRQLGFSKQL